MPNKKEDLDLCVKKTGLTLIVHKFEENNYITKEDIDEFLRDTDLPEKPAELLMEEMISCGGSSGGFKKLTNFFLFLIRNLNPLTLADSLQAFQHFDNHDTGFIDMMFMSDIVRHIGDKMEDRDIDSFISVSEVDENGALNYDEVLMKSLNRFMELEIAEMVKVPVSITESDTDVSDVI